MNQIYVAKAWLVFVVVFCLLRCTTSVKNHAESHSRTAISGSDLAKKHCSACHLFPDPALLDKETWRTETLPAMAFRFGIYNDRSRESLLESGIARTTVEQANIFPKTQTISDEEWNAICNYYSQNAPERLQVLKDSVTMLEQTDSFLATVLDFKIARPAVSALLYDDRKRQLYVADCSRDDYSSITILDSSFKPVTSLGLPHPISNLTLHEDTLFILSMGHFVPSDEPAGQLLKAMRKREGYEGYKVVLKNLKRPVDVAFADFDADGKDEIVVCEFGNHTGAVSLFVRKAKRSYSRTILYNAPGAIKVEIADMNSDNRKDIVVLMAQGDEGVDVYYNMGAGKFSRKRILRFPPVYGSTSIAVTDFNKDGLPDIVYVNGDNGDASRVLKPYHGIRIFLGDKNNSYNEISFLQLPGAYKAITLDFDDDGDLDIAAISFFPDFENRPEQGFIYFENTSKNADLKFVPRLIKGTDRGRWISMTTCDTDRTGYKDIVLGSFTSIQFAKDTVKFNVPRSISLIEPLLVLNNRRGL